MRGLLIGTGRSSKSTLALTIVRTCKLFDVWEYEAIDYKQIDAVLEITHYVENNIIYKDREQVIEIIKKEYAPYIIADDSVFLADSRRFFEGGQVFMSEAMNGYADSNAITLMLCQALNILDTRFIDGSNFIFLVSDRGEALFFSKEKNYPIVKNTFGFERFQKHPKLLATRKKAEFSLRGLPSFCTDVEYADLQGSRIWDLYKENKKLHKEEKEEKQQKKKS